MIWPPVPLYLNPVFSACFGMTLRDLPVIVHAAQKVRMQQKLERFVHASSGTYCRPCCIAQAVVRCSAWQGTQLRDYVRGNKKAI